MTIVPDKWLKSGSPPHLDAGTEPDDSPFADNNAEEITARTMRNFAYELDVRISGAITDIINSIVNGGGGSGGCCDAANTPFDPTGTGLESTNVQDAIEEIAAGSGGGGTGECCDAANTPFDPTDTGLESTNVQDAIEELAPGLWQSLIITNPKFVSVGSNRYRRRGDIIDIAVHIRIETDLGGQGISIGQMPDGFQAYGPTHLAGVALVQPGGIGPVNYGWASFIVEDDGTVSVLNAFNTDIGTSLMLTAVFPTFPAVWPPGQEVQ